MDRLFFQQREPWSTIQRLADADENGDGSHPFQVIQDPPVQAGDARPWLVWVHPGDACESDHPIARVRRAASRLEQAMGEEILALAATHRLCVLHRLSSPFAFEINEWRVAQGYEQAMAAVHDTPDAVVLHGDDLEAAAHWLGQRLPPAQSVFLTGAWSDPTHGCVTAIGQALQSAGFTVRVSAHSPSNAGSTRGGWRPHAPTRRRPSP